MAVHLHISEVMDRAGQQHYLNGQSVLTLLLTPLSLYVLYPVVLTDCVLNDLISRIQLSQNLEVCRSDGGDGC